MLSEYKTRQGYILVDCSPLGDVAPGLGPCYGLELEGILKFDTKTTALRLDETFGFSGSSRCLWRWPCKIPWFSEQINLKKLEIQVCLH